MTKIQKLAPQPPVQEVEVEVAKEPTMYYLHLKTGSNEVESISASKSATSTSKGFSAAFLLDAGIYVNEDAGYAELNPFVAYTYDKEENKISSSIRMEKLDGMQKTTRRISVEQAITAGFTFTIAGESRLYRCELQDQIAITHSPMLANLSEHKICDIKCLVDGEDKRRFVAHSVEECDLVLLTMARHILQKRKEYAEQD